MDPDILVSIAGMATGVIVVVALARTVRYWIERHYEHKRRMMDGSAPAEVVRVAERMAALEEDLSGRLLDLEERVDFTERVLARGRERELLEGGDR